MNNKVKIGYTQGTFDMFHIGHLNLIKKASEFCDYLIVGVNSDELVQSYKNKNTIVPLEERVSIIDSLEVVDRVVIAETLDKNYFLNELGFNCIFIGDDWKNDKRWIQTKEDMKKKNVDVVFLPYTHGTSSTILREKLLKREN